MKEKRLSKAYVVKNLREQTKLWIQSQGIVTTNEMLDNIEWQQDRLVYAIRYNITQKDLMEWELLSKKLDNEMTYYLYNIIRVGLLEEGIRISDIDEYVYRISKIECISPRDIVKIAKREYSKVSTKDSIIREEYKIPKKIKKVVIKVDDFMENDYYDVQAYKPSGKAQSYKIKGRVNAIQLQSMLEFLGIHTESYIEEVE